MNLYDFSVFWSHQGLSSLEKALSIIISDERYFLWTLERIFPEIERMETR